LQILFLAPSPSRGRLGWDEDEDEDEDEFWAEYRESIEASISFNIVILA
jgi:hypothetical protein